MDRKESLKLVLENLNFVGSLLSGFHLRPLFLIPQQLAITSLRISLSSP